MNIKKKNKEEFHDEIIQLLKNLTMNKKVTLLSRYMDACRDIQRVEQQFVRDKML